MDLSYKEKGKDVRHKPLNHYVMGDGTAVAIYQGFWTIIGLAAGSVLSQYQIDAMTICGGLMLVGISLRLLDIKRIPVANLLPALVIAPALATVLHLFK